MDWTHYRAALFDLDGVVTPTAEVHMRAWARLFGAVLADHPGQAPYTDADYFDHIDGKPRLEGVRSWLEARGIDLPEGGPEDPPEAATVNGLGRRKNDEFTRVLREEGIVAYPGSLALIERLREQGIAMAIVSSSRNAPEVLATAQIAHLFDTVMDGAVAAERGLAGKPAPDTFLAAAADLGVESSACVVLEDAVSGVRAGAAGDFGLVVGVDRGVGAQVLDEAGADLVVSDLAELLP